MWPLARGRQIVQHLFTALDRVDLASNHNPNPKVHKMDPGFLITAQEQAAKAHFRCSLFPDIISLAFCLFSPHQQVLSFGFATYDET